MKNTTFLAALTTLGVVLFAAPTRADYLTMATSCEPDTGGNGMAKRSVFDIYGRENQANMHPHGWAEVGQSDTDMEKRKAEDESEAARERAREEHNLSFGNDIRGLQGVQTAAALNGLHHLNLKQIELAKLAESVAKSEVVLNVAHRIRADHEMLERKVEALASRRNIKLEPYRLAEPEQVVLARLKMLKGREFEESYMRVTERGQRESEHMLMLVRADVPDAQVRELISETIPVLTAHLDMENENRARARLEEEELGK